MSTLSWKKVKTRKPHRCFGCYRRFGAGTAMEKWSCIHESEFCSGYTCTTCQALQHHFWPDPGEGWDEGFVSDSLEFMGQTPEGLLMALEQDRKKELERALSSAAMNAGQYKPGADPIRGHHANLIIWNEPKP